MTQPAVDADLAVMLGSLDASVGGERGDLILWRVVDLFERDAERLSTAQVELFDLVLGRLIDRIETSARIALSQRLARHDRAPPALMQRLSLDERIEIAGPVLTFSECVGEGMLIACARTSSQLHLLALSQRASLPPQLTDILVERGELPVLRSVAGNGGAGFSDFGFRNIIARAGRDDDVALALGGRVDLPAHHFLKLLSLASQAARIRLEATSPHSAGDIRDAVDRVTQLIGAKAQAPAANYTAACREVDSRGTAGALGEGDAFQFAMAGQKDQLAVTLAKLAGVPLGLVDAAFRQERAEGLLVLTRALDFSWTTARQVLIAKTLPRSLTSHNLEQAAVSFERLKPETAARALNLQRARYTS